MEETILINCSKLRQEEEKIIDDIELLNKIILAMSYKYGYDYTKEALKKYAKTGDVNLITRDKDLRTEVINSENFITYINSIDLDSALNSVKTILPEESSEMSKEQILEEICKETYLACQTEARNYCGKIQVAGSLVGIKYNNYDKITRNNNARQIAMENIKPEEVLDLIKSSLEKNGYIIEDELDLYELYATHIEHLCSDKKERKKIMIRSKKGMLIVLSGPSGVGKGTICNYLLDYFNAWYSISVTTREKRDNEQEGINYFYVSKEDFLKKIEDNEFLEYATYNNNYYGTLKSKIDEKLNKNIDVICEIEVKGAKNIKEKYPDSVLIYILPPSLKELETRLRNRETEDEETIRKRMNITKEELKQIDFYDYVVVNDDLELAIETVKRIIESEKCKVSRNNIDWSN